MKVKTNKSSNMIISFVYLFLDRLIQIYKDMDRQRNTQRDRQIDGNKNKYNLQT